MTLRGWALAAACIAAAPPAPAMAQSPPGVPSTAVPPDPKHIISVLPRDLKWHVASLGQLQAPLYGDPDKPGPYAVAIKWLPHHMSQPHTHSTDRFAYVVRGVWWVSSSSTFDPKTMWPVQPGTFAVDFANTVHWDGAKDQEVLLIVYGDGPMVTKKLKP